MIGRVGVGALVLGLFAGLPAGVAMAEDRDEMALKRSEAYNEVMVQEDDGDDGMDGLTATNTGATNTVSNDNTGTNETSGDDSNDATGSGNSAISNDRDRSWGDNTQDFTQDGGSRTRDHSGGQTNDRSRNDTR